MTSSTFGGMFGRIVSGASGAETAVGTTWISDAGGVEISSGFTVSTPGAGCVAIGNDICGIAELFASAITS